MVVNINYNFHIKISKITLLYHTYPLTTSTTNKNDFIWQNWSCFGNLLYKVNLPFHLLTIASVKSVSFFATVFLITPLSRNVLFNTGLQEMMTFFTLTCEYEKTHQKHRRVTLDFVRCA